MKSVTYIILAIMVLFPCVVLGDIFLYAHCAGDSVNITIDVMNSPLNEGETGHGIHVLANYTGTCEEPIVVTASPLPMPLFEQSAIYELNVPSVDLLRFFRYSLWGVDPDGLLYSLAGVSNYAWAGCENAVISRGYLISGDGDDYLIEACPDSCWDASYPGCRISFQEAQPGWEQFLDSGVLIDFYGGRRLFQLPGHPCIYVTRVEAVDSSDGCGAVTARSMSWDSLKAQYR